MLLRTEYILQTGAASRTWGVRGNDETGTGWRARPVKWKKGVSGKQNKDYNKPKEPCDDLVSAFSFFFHLLLICIFMLQHPDFI